MYVCLYFQFDKNDKKAASKLFSVPDFIGYSCSQLGITDSSKLKLQKILAIYFH